MRTITLTLLLFLILSVPTFGYSSWESYPATSAETDAPAIAWMEDDVLYVAVANPGSSRERFYVEPTSRNRSSHNPFDRFSMVLGARTVMLESVRLDPSWHPRWDGDVTEVIVDAGRRGRHTIPVQQLQSAMDSSNFVAYADDVLEVTVDLLELIEDLDFHRMVVDTSYRILGTNQTGRISVSSFQGGFNMSSSRNEITYSRPTMTLRMQAPRIRDIGLLTFDITHIDGRSRQEAYASPLVLIIGSDYRFIDNASVVSSRSAR